jgi:glycosyltransferase involved in cell wall biosynthesis
VVKRWTVSSAQAKDMTRNGEARPHGFAGPVTGFCALVPSGERTLRLPRERDTLFAGTTPAERFDVISCDAVTESLGRIEDVLARAAACLAPGGTIVLDADNLQSLRMLRQVVEGRPGSLEPVGSVQDPSQALSLRRLLQAASAASLRVVDVVAVPGAPIEAAGFPRALFAHGLMAIDWVGGAPPARHWLVLRNESSLAGSVLLAGGDAAARERTAETLRTFLPADWEIVARDEKSEAVAFNRAVAQARGEVVWFVRAGAEVTSALFEALSAQAFVGAAAPGVDGARSLPGDLVLTMAPRLDVLAVGPIDEHYGSAQVALEDWLMRCDGKLPPTTLVPVAARMRAIAPPPTSAPADVLQADGERLLARWSVVGEQNAVPATAAPAPAAAPAPVAPWAGRKPRITLCMIARNEERFLGDCLAHARAAFDEFVLVDTGSTDRTVAIAESFGAKVIHSPWNDDFAAPRTLGMQAATGDWILVLDADEFLQPGAAETLRELAEDPTALGYHLHFVNLYGSGKTLGVMMVRFFRNLPGIEYRSVIHEQVTPSLQRIGGPLGLTLRSADVLVEHHGYTDEVMDQRGKNERNERLFVKQLAAEPDDVYGHYKYGDFLRRLPNRSRDARRLLERCLELILAGAPDLPMALPYAGEVAALCALEAERVGDRRRAREVVDLALRRFLPTPNLHYIAASLALADGHAAEAILHYRRCLAYRGQVLVVPIQDGITSYVSLTGIAQAWAVRGDLTRAIRLVEKALAIQPDYEVAHLALSRFCLQQGDPARALSVLTTYLASHPDSPGACQQTALILQRLGRTDAAKRMGNHAVRVLEARALDTEAAAMKETLAAL